MNTFNSLKLYRVTAVILSVAIISFIFSSCSSAGASEKKSNPESYTITFNPQHGNVVDEKQTIKNHEKINKLPTPSRDKYEFKGWYTTTRGGVEADLDDYNIPTDSSFTLYAHWAPIEYYQFDEKWATEKYSTNEYNDTVRGSGCGPGVMAIADATINGSNADIGTACKWSLDHDYFTSENGRTKDGFFEAYGNAHNLKVTQMYSKDLRDASQDEAQSIHEKAFESVKDGNWIVAFMGKGIWTTGGHFVLWYDVDDENNVYIRDTNSMKPQKAKNEFDVFKETVIRYWEIKVPDDKKLFST